MKLVCTSCSNVRQIKEDNIAENTIYCLCHNCLLRMGKKLKIGKNRKSRRKALYL